MEWIGWAFAAVAAVLLTVFIFLYLHQKQQAQHQHKKDQKAQAKLQTEMSRMQKELYHERDIIGLIQEHMVEGILILDDSDKIQLANRTATGTTNPSSSSPTTRHFWMRCGSPKQSRSTICRRLTMIFTRAAPCASC